ncbi:YraN family protein [Ectothiorhodospiraceae bacterium 2226]|nr:YraN family protein [Ectothiorhodospiraceae bacterium 2226]
MSGGARERGLAAETTALQFLERRGLRLVERNARSARGEIDLVMDDNGTLVFVEVRYRANPRYGSGADSVGRIKQTRLIAAAQAYLQRSGAHRRPARFDVVSIGPADAIDWIPDAFQA